MSANFKPSETPTQAQGTSSSENRASKLLSSVLSLVGSLDLTEVLQAFVDQACILTTSEYGALSVLDSRGETTRFFTRGIALPEYKKIGNPPVGRGLIGEIQLNKGLIVNDIPSHPKFSGFPNHHPKMRRFLGVPLKIHEQVFGRLYLCDKPDDYTENDMAEVSAIASVAAVAVENSLLYKESRQREQWTQVSQKLITTLLEGADEEEALRTIAHEIRLVAQADTAMLILPSVGETWACEIVDGVGGDELLGAVFPPKGRAMTVLAEGQGLVIDSFARANTLRLKPLAKFGPALYAPLLAGGHAIGILLLLRLPDKPEFDLSILQMAQNAVSQTALALEIASAKHAEDMATLLDERAKIGEDLHDLAIQQLFATGMQLDRVRDAFKNNQQISAQQVIELVDQALASVDDSVKQIRAIVHNLREPDAAVDLVERLRREASLSRTSLGFAPTLLISLDGQVLSRKDTQGDSILSLEVDQRVGRNIADDVVAVTREALSNTARHAGASSARVTVDVEGSGSSGVIRMEISDDGCGIDPRVTRRSGLDNIVSRARRHHGKCAIISNPNHGGVKINWQVPLG